MTNVGVIEVSLVGARRASARRHNRATEQSNRIESAMASSLEDDDPRQSSAALCISLNLLGETFGPEFTHQCFPGEWIRGYQPQQALLAGAKHSSHQRHDQAKHTLQVDITLSPSCRQCEIKVQVQRKPREIVTRASKRPRLSTAPQQETADTPSEEVYSSEEPLPSNNDEDDSDFTASEEDENSHPNEAGVTRARRMPIEQVMEQCAKALPAIVEEIPEDDYLTAPIGNVVKEYQRNSMNFVMSLADGSDAAEYHDQVQKLALWFIETADSVNLASSEGGGYWKVLYIFRKHSKEKYSLVGYMTVFHFRSPFKKPKSGIVARVCQVLILPPYQRMGHGKALLQQVYDMAHDSNNDIVEINVEDPAAACTALRNLLDYQLLKESLNSETPWLDSTYHSTTDVSDPDFFKPVSDADAVQAGALACITPRQVQIAHEIYKLSLLPKDCSEEVHKNYRLMVKKRLAKVHREELGGCASKEEKQALLAKIFDETFQQYKSVLKLDK